MSHTVMPSIRLENISKSFGPTKANQDICLDIECGQILALLGENGAGKSTLMSILAGQLRPDAGRILIDGHPVAFNGTKSAINAGIGMVYQHFMLVDAMTVTENIYLGQSSAFWLHPRRMEQRVAALAAQYNLEIDPCARIADLSMGERQRVEILKLLLRQSQYLIFDEPTAVLTPQEAEQLFGALRQMARQGKAIVFISHKLGEVMALADRIAVLRHGRVVDTLKASAVTSRSELARRMVGREVLLQIDKEPLEPKQRVLRIAGLNHRLLKDFSLEVRQGEILGIVGVAGNGQKPLAEIVCGLQAPEAGDVNILGQPWQRFFKRRSWDNALAYVPEDRQGLATCLELDLVDNFLLTTRQGFTRGPWLNREQAVAKASQVMSTFGVHPSDPRARARQLSGGNLQKMVLAREFFRRPRLIVAEQPTQGLDIAATEEVWRLLLQARERAGILLITGDLSEALALADRLAVMFDGRIVDSFPATDSAKIDQIGLMMAGISASHRG
jgi:simple sugar transport system ATP-binding protein